MKVAAGNRSLRPAGTAARGGMTLEEDCREWRGYPMAPWALISARPQADIGVRGRGKGLCPVAPSPASTLSTPCLVGHPPEGKFQQLV